MCKHYQKVGYSNYCEILKNREVSEPFITICKAFKDLNPGRTMIPNGECFWMLDEMPDCPYYE